MQSSTQQPPQQNSPHPRKGTPGRRRHSRQVSQSHGRKMYVSENDMPSDTRIPVEFSLGPFTPQKSASNSPAPPSARQSNTKSKSRNGAKSRPSNVSTSPGPAKPDRKTPPYSAAPKASAGTAFTNEAVFAGATFHASPAPGSLPIPSFLAKTMDSPSVKDPGRASQEPSPPVTDSETPTPQHQANAAKPVAEESPLAIIFQADRAEKERNRRASSANALSAGPGPVPRPGPFSPPLQSIPPQEPKTAPQMNQIPQNRRAPLQRNSSGISTMELDGTPGRPMGPAFSTPYQERIRAARSSEKQFLPSQVSQTSSQGLPQPQAHLADRHLADRSEELMRFLGVKPPSCSQANEMRGSPNHAPAAPNHTVSATFVEQDFRGTDSTASQRAGASRPPNVLRMEEDLRKMLNINRLNLGPASTTASYQSS